MLTSNIKNSEWDINESIQACFFSWFPFFFLNIEICEHKEEIYMSSSFVMFVSEFEFPIE